MCWRRWLLHLWQDISEWSFEPLEGAASCGSLDKYIKLLTHVYKSCIILCVRYVYYPSPLLDAVCPFSSAHQKPTARLPGCLAFQLQYIKHILGCRYVWYYIVRLCCVSVAQLLLEMISISLSLPFCLLVSNLCCLLFLFVFPLCWMEKRYRRR